MSYSIEKVFGGYVVSINNGNTVKTFYDVNEDIIDIIKQLEEENKRLKQWDCNKDSRNSRQRTENAKLQKKINLLNKRWDNLKEWVKGYQGVLKIQEDSIEGLDIFEEHALVVLDDITAVMEEMENNYE